MKVSATAHLTLTFRGGPQYASYVRMVYRIHASMLQQVTQNIVHVGCHFGTQVVAGSHVTSTVFLYTCYLHPPPPPTTPAAPVFEDKRQLIIKQLTLPFSHPVSVSSSRRGGGLIFNGCHPRQPECLPVCVRSLP
jgi:hypothetical protein